MADDILNKNDSNLFCNNAKEKYECELCLDMFNLYDRKPVCLVPCVSINLNINSSLEIKLSVFHFN
jgi:hypothetical protein